MYMTHPLVEKVKGFLLKPSETFRATRSESLSCAYQYYVVLLIIYSVLLAIVVAASFGIVYFSTMTAIASSGALGSGGTQMMKAFMPFLISYVLFLPYLIFFMMLFGVFFSSLCYHVFVILFGGQKGLAQTVKTAMYAATPLFIIGWIPFVSIIGMVWSWILFIIGIRENQEMTTGRAVLVFIVPVILSLILVLGLFAVIGSFFGAFASMLKI